MKDERLEEYLRRSLGRQTAPKRLEETIALCREQTRSQAAPVETRQGFWGFLSDVFHLEGIPILLSQAGVLLLVCLAAGSSSGNPCEIPMYMPLFILAILPALFRGKVYRVSEIEAATRASWAQIALARLILAGAATLICVTVLLGLEVYLQRSYEALGRMVLYCLVPYLVGMTVTLCFIRRRVGDSIQLSVVMTLGSSVFWYVSTQTWPWLYEISAVGVWIAAFVVFTAFFAREISFIIQANREGKMYGIVN